METKTGKPLKQAAEELSRRLEPEVQVLLLPAVDSTNTALKTLLARGGLTRPTLLMTDCQTAGRGTRGRQWLQVGGRDLALTLALPREGATLRDQRLSLAVGSLIAMALEEALALELGVKWPNDVLAQVKGTGGGWRKVGGVLLETRAGWLFAGVGINVNSSAGDYPAELGPSLTTLRDVLGREIDRDQVVVAVGEALTAGLSGTVDINALMRQWLKRDKTAGTRYELKRCGRRTSVAASHVIPESGELVCLDDEGLEYAVRSYTELDHR